MGDGSESKRSTDADSEDGRPCCRAPNELCSFKFLAESASLLFGLDGGAFLVIHVSDVHTTPTRSRGSSQSPTPVTRMAGARVFFQVPRRGGTCCSPNEFCCTESQSPPLCSLDGGGPYWSSETSTFRTSIGFRLGVDRQPHPQPYPRRPPPSRDASVQPSRLRVLGTGKQADPDRQAGTQADW